MFPYPILKDIHWLQYIFECIDFNYPLHHIHHYTNLDISLNIIYYSYFTPTHTRISCI